MSKRTTTALLLALVVLQGCETATTYSLVETGTRDMGLYTVDTPIEWNRRNRSPGAGESWTVDGEALQALIFRSGIKDGEHLFVSMPEDQARVFRPDMRAGDVAELFVESYSLSSGAVAVRIEDLRPADFGPWEGFRFDLQYTLPTGLEGRSVVLGAVVNSELHLIMYRGARHYYFEKYLPQVEQILASIQAVQG